nr:T9SS type A sorting domain-containing protein [Bacteroidota bacterium]
MKSIHTLVLLVLLALIPIGFVSASGFIADTLINDTLFPERISFDPGIFLSPLSKEVGETSGLMFHDNELWTHNDSGGEPELYKINLTSGNIDHTCRIGRISNVDWEDITDDENFIYIGDFGNNAGVRKNLKIYKIPQGMIQDRSRINPEDVEIINFSYADQVGFERKTNRHNFDCEAFLSRGDSLYLFTKNWQDEKTRLYLLPKNAGDYSVSPRDEFDADGLITGACINPDGTEVALIGYKDYESFLWLFWDYEKNDFFDGRKMRVDFPDLVFVQTEGITYISNNDVLISCEESAEPPTLFKVNTDELKGISLSRLTDYFPSDIRIAGMPDTFTKKIKFDILELPDPKFTVELRNSKWVKLFEEHHTKDDKRKKVPVSIAVRDVKSGVYFIRILSGGCILVKKIVIKH